MAEYYKLEISAETEQQAYEILDALLAKKLVTGGQIIQAPARFLWKGKINTMDYYTVTSFSLEKHTSAITKTVETTSIEEVPMITFLPMEGNQKLLEWITETVA